MSTEDNVLTTETRSSLGSRASTKARRKGRIPVNIFGHGKPNCSVTVDAHDLEMALSTTAQVFTLAVGGGQESCLVKEVQYDTFGQHVLHVDLARIDLTEEVDVVVALEFRGNAAGLADGGVQIIHHPSLAVHCPAGSIPDSILVEVEGLELNQTLHAGEIALPKGVKLDTRHMAEDEPVVGIVAPKIEEVEEPEEGLEDGEAGEAGETPKGEDGKDGDKGDGKGGE